MNSNPQARGEKVVNNRGVMTSLGHRQYRCDVMHMLTTASVLLLISLDVKRSMSDAFIIAPWTVPYKRAVASGSQVWVNPRRQSRPALQLRQEAPCDGVPRRRRRIQVGNFYIPTTDLACYSNITTDKGILLSTRAIMLSSQLQ